MRLRVRRPRERMNVAGMALKRDSSMSLAALRCADKCGVVLSTHAGDVFEHGADDVHPVIDVDEIHYRHDQQGHAPIGSVPRSAGQTGHGRARQEVGEGTNWGVTLLVV